MTKADGREDDLVHNLLMWRTSGQQGLIFGPRSHSKSNPEYNPYCTLSSVLIVAHPLQPHCIFGVQGAAQAQASQLGVETCIRLRAKGLQACREANGRL